MCLLKNRAHELVISISALIEIAPVWKGKSETVVQTSIPQSFQTESLFSLLFSSLRAAAKLAERNTMKFQNNPKNGRLSSSIQKPIAK